jgi:hypothetical protein
MTFDAALRFTLRWEGGKVDHPSDRGGRTAYGITQRRYDAWRRELGQPVRDVWLIEKQEMRTIYERHYWRPVADLAWPLAAAAFDFAVNSGVSRARRYLPPDRSLTVYLDAREAFFHRIVARDASQRVFLRGWLNRMAALRRFVEGVTPVTPALVTVVTPRRGWGLLDRLGRAA